MKSLSRSMLTTADTVLTIAQLLLVMCLTLGYTGSMLRIARGQYASPNSLKAGGERIWVLLRTRLLQMLIMTAAAFALCFLVINVCLLTPLSNRVIAVMGTVSAEELLSNGLALIALYSAMLPIILIYLVALVPLLWYFSCTYRMVDYLLIDRPQLGAFGVLRESRRMMQGNMKMMLRVDLSFWWYYLLQALVSVLVGTKVGDLIAKTPLGADPIVGTPIRIFCSTMVSGLISCTLLLVLDRSKFINKAITALNMYLTENQSFRQIAYDFETYAARIAAVDVEQFRKDTESFQNIADEIYMADDDEELEGILVAAFEALAIPAPWSGDFDEFMGNPNNKLIFG